MDLDELVQNPNFKRMFPEKRELPFFIWDGKVREVLGSSYHNLLAGFSPEDFDVLILKLSANVTHKSDPTERDKVLKGIETQIKYALGSDKRVIVVASGARAYGEESLPEGSNPVDVYRTGQRLLMNKFRKMDLNVKEFLLTPESMRDTQLRQQELGKILECCNQDYVPVLNVDDVARIKEDAELRREFSSNDVLACRYVAPAVKELGNKPLIIMLGSEAGIYEKESYRRYTCDKNVRFPNVIRVVLNGTGLESQIIPERESAKGTGGLGTKLEAIEFAKKAGIPIMMAQGFQYNQGSLLQGCWPVIALLDKRYVGTIFKPRGD